ncbi:hypothetical protein KM043_010940 [Ampulex compressa]|nr:hypothetical protein KM043_010940 [Ampulex compressa]
MDNAHLDGPGNLGPEDSPKGNRIIVDYNPRLKRSDAQRTKDAKFLEHLRPMHALSYTTQADANEYQFLLWSNSGTGVQTLEYAREVREVNKVGPRLDASPLETSADKIEPRD